MVEVDITRLSSKGQIVIPNSLRKGLNEGDKMIIFRDKNNIVLRKASSMDEKLREDLEFARRTEEAWKEYGKGNFKKYSVVEFLKRL